MSKKLEIIRKICQPEVFGKDIIYEENRYTLEEFVAIDEAITVNHQYGLNSPRFNDGKIEFRRSAMTLLKSEDHLFILEITPDGFLSFFPVISWTEEDSLDELHKKISRKAASRVPYSTFVLLLGALIGFIIKYVEVKKATEVKFTGLFERVKQLYMSAFKSKSIHKLLKDHGYEAITDQTVLPLER